MSLKLYKLIQSLSRAEKKHFSRYSKMYSDKGPASYNVLFRIFEQMKIFNKDDLKKLVGENLIDSNISQTKNYLFFNILNSLLGIKKNFTPAEEIMKHIQYSIILTEKGLYTEALEILTKIKEKAYITNRWDFILSIIRQEVVVITKTLKSDHSVQLKKYFKEEQEVIEKMQNVNQYGYLVLQFQTIMKDQLIKSNFINYRESLQAISTDPLMLDISKAFTVQAKARFYFLKFSLVEVVENKEEIITLTKQFLEFTIKNYKPLGIFYINSVKNNILQYLLDENKLDLFKAVLNTIETKTTKKGELGYNYFIKSINQLLYLNKFKKVQGIEVDEIINNLEKHELPIQQQYPLLSQLALYFHHAKQHSKVIKYTNQWQIIVKQSFHNQDYLLIKLLEITSHLDLENKEVARSIVYNTKRTLKSKGLLNVKASTALKYLHKISNLKKPNDIKLFNKFQKEWESVEGYKQNYDLYNFSLFDWIQTKVSEFSYN